MKSRLPLSVSALVASATCLVMSPVKSSAAESATPTGWLTATPGVVAVGAFPTLNWNIEYPSEVKNHVDIEEPGKIIPKTRLKMEIRVLGAGVTTSYANGSNLTFVHTEGWFRLNNNSWDRLFSGTNHDVKQNKVVFKDTVESGQSLRFGGRFWHPNGYWSNFYSSNDGTQNVRVLVNGDTPPTTFPLATAPSLEDFIKPYLDSSGKVRIGPMDAIVMMELTHTDAQNRQSGYDLQDMVFLVTFKKS